jgi:hypothetical protein
MINNTRDGKDFPQDDRVWYDQFTSTDWVHDSIADAYRVKALRARKDLRGRIKAFLDGAEGWILSALVGFLAAVVAYVVDVSEAPFFDWKDGYCVDGFLLSEKVFHSFSFLLYNPHGQLHISRELTLSFLMVEGKLPVFLYFLCLSL